MSRNRFSQRDARLGDLLRQGDPAADEPGLSTEELQAMRRAVLTAAPERRRLGWIPVFATGAAVALAVLLAVLLWRGGEDQGVRVPEEKVATVPAEPARPAIPPAIPEAPAAPEPSREPAPVKEPVRKRTAVPRALPPPVPGEAEPLKLAAGTDPSLPKPEGEEPRTRHIEFSTPGGTRVIWVLTEDEILLQ